jgi:hypothetical protein
MLKIVFITITTILLVGCTPTSEDVTEDYKLPKELKECVVYRLSDGNNVLRVIKCPLSVTSTSQQIAKKQQSAIVISE